MTGASDPLVGQLIDGRWRIVERIGEGGFGVVYRAERIKLGKLVAIKFLDERGMKSKEAVARFEREARAISRVQHRHSVTINDFGVHEQRPYIVMEHLSGVPLGQVMGRPSMTPQRGVRILSQMLEALDHAHRNGVVHRDLKPDNVMLVEMTGGRDFVKLLDFGLARIISLDEPTISMPHMVAGTPSYMSPEQARGEKTDHRTDLYSAGVILYGLCTGRKPFRADDGIDILRMQISAAPPKPREVAPDRKISEALEQVILRALEKKPDDRFLHAKAFLDALEATPEGGDALGGGRKRPARSRGMWAAGFLLAIGAVAALAGRPYALSAWTSLRAIVHAQRPTQTNTPPDRPTMPPDRPNTPPDRANTPPVQANTPPVQANTPPDRANTPPDRANAPEPATEAAAEEPAALPEPPKVDPKPVPSSPEERVAALVDGGELAEAERQSRAEEILQPGAGWPHLYLGEIYFRRLWRKDAEREWTMALELDPKLKSDTRLAAGLCPTLGKAWKGTGERLAAKLGARAVAPLTGCIRDAQDADRVHAAVRAIERAAGRGKVDRALVAARLAQLSHTR